VLLLLLACAYHGAVWALWAGGCRLLEQRLGLSWLVSAPLLLALLETIVPFIFPWYLAITVWRAWPLGQVAELGGPPVVSALVVLINVTLAMTAAALVRRERPGREVKVAALVVVALVALGALRAVHVGVVRGRAPALTVGLVQPNFGIVSSDDRKHRGERYIETLRRETAAVGQQGATLVVLPESAFPFLFNRDQQREFAPGHPWELRGPYRGRLLLGALTHRFDTSFVYNSAVLFGADGRVAGTYDKNRLMPFGEYLPFADDFPDWAARMRKRLPEWPTIADGGEPLVLADGNLTIAPLICYEDLDVAAVHRVARRGPNLLVTLANHAWFRASAAPRQALALATLRSIETRRDLVRATNTGVSAFVDALGRVRAHGALLDVPRDQPGAPATLVGEARLLEIFALGPWASLALPYLLLAGLLGAAVRAGLRRREE
jgi:apolipoprotein N-acyltransferase